MDSQTNSTIQWICDRALPFWAALKQPQSLLPPQTNEHEGTDHSERWDLINTMLVSKLLDPP